MVELVWPTEGGRQGQGQGEERCSRPYKGEWTGADTPSQGAQGAPTSDAGAPARAGREGECQRHRRGGGRLRLSRLGRLGRGCAPPSSIFSSFLLSPVAVSSPSPSPITFAIELTPCRVCHRCSCVIRLSLNPRRHHASNADSCTGQPPDTHSEHPEHATLLATSACRPPIVLTVLTVTDLLPLRIHEKPLIIFT